MELDNLMPTETEHFNSAPIVEAIVGIDLAEMLSENSLPVLRSLGKRLEPTYTINESIVFGQFQFEIGSGHQPRQESIELGYFFRTSDRVQVVQARRNGFGFSRLAPYQKWEPFIYEAKKAWTLYREAIGVAKIKKWMIRYVNKLSWPEGDPIEKYFQIYPHIPENLPQIIQGVFMRLLIPIDIPKGMLIQQFVQVPSDKEGQVSFILDNEFSFDAEGLSDFELWEQIELGRAIKNEFFINAITQKTREMIA